MQPITVTNITKQMLKRRKKKCSLESCKNKTTAYYSVLHRMPTTVDIANIWKIQCGFSKDIILPKCFALCTKHFLPTDYRKGLPLHIFIEKKCIFRHLFI